MVTAYGMNSKVGNVSFYDPTQENTFTKPFSEETGKIIDEEVRGIIDEAYQRTLELLKEKKKEVEILAKELLDKEVLHKSDVELLIGKRPFEDKATVIPWANRLLNLEHPATVKNLLSDNGKHI
jgi:cell division protease FtsH